MSYCKILLHNILLESSVSHNFVLVILYKTNRMHSDTRHSGETISNGRFDSNNCHNNNTECNNYQIILHIFCRTDYNIDL